MGTTTQGKLNGEGAPSGTSAAAPRPTEEQVKQGLVKSQRVLLALGEIMSVLMRSRVYRATALADIHDMVTPAVSCEQYLIARAYSAANGLTVPVAAALWARVSQAVDKRLTEQVEGPTQLAPAEWTSGDIPWLIAYLGDPGAINPMLEVLQNKTLGGKVLKVRTRDADGRFVTRAFNPVATPPGVA